MRVNGPRSKQHTVGQKTKVLREVYRTMINNPHPFPEQYYLLGNPVSHSLSSEIHSRFAYQTGQACTYSLPLCKNYCFY